jgi:hypothetical protein
MKIREFWMYETGSAYGDGYDEYPVIYDEYLVRSDKPPIEEIKDHIHVREVWPELDAAYEECVKALADIDNWFEDLKKHQEPILETNFQEAADPECWPDDLKSFSFEKAKNALEALKKARREQ